MNEMLYGLRELEKQQHRKPSTFPLDEKINITESNVSNRI